MQLERPQVIDLVAIGEFEALFDREQQTLDDLQRRSREAQQSALEFERQLAEEGVHPETARWMILRFNEFLRDLRAEADEEVAAILDHARRLAAAPRIPEVLRLSFGGAFAARNGRSGCDVIRWSAQPKATCGHGAAVAPEPPRAFAAVEAVKATEQAALVVDPIAPSNVSDLFSDVTTRDDVDDFGVEVAAATSPDRSFWSDDDEPRSWWRRHAHISATAAFTAAAIVIAALAFAVQVA